MERTRTLTLPFPPSVNTYWRHGSRGSYLSKAGKRFRVEAIAAIDEQLGNVNAILDRDVAVSMKLHRYDHRSYDVDNYSKGVLDALEHSGVLGNDSQVRRLTVEKCEVIKGGKCEVTIIELT